MNKFNKGLKWHNFKNTVVHITPIWVGGGGSWDGWLGSQGS